jgi:hypothetical protein
MSTLLHGADYRPRYAPAARTKAEWQRLLAAAIKAGGWRRVERSETFIHGADGHLVHEVYAYIPEVVVP